jgi:hypothetical protein
VTFAAVVGGQTRSPARFDIGECVTVDPSGDYWMGFYFMNSGKSKISFTAKLHIVVKKQLEGAERTTSIVVPTVVAGFEVLLVGFFLAKRHYQVGA